MALRFIDGFDHYTTATAMAYKWTTVKSVTPNKTGRRSGSLAVQVGGYSQIAKALDAQSTWVVGFAFKIDTFNTGDRGFLDFRDADGTVQVYFILTSAGLIRAYRGNGTLLATGSTNLLAGTWYYLEFKVTIADSNGAIEVRQNGTTIMTYAGDTKNSSTYASACMIYIGAYTTWETIYFVDDLYVCDGTGSVNNDFLGDVRVDTLLPTGAGSSTQFTPVGNAANYSNVCEAIPDGDTTYNYADTAGYTDSFAVGDLTLLGATIFGVQSNLLARKDDAGTRTMAPNAYISGTNYAGTTQSLADTYIDLLQLWENNPATSSAWTEAVINGAEFGYKVVA